MINIRDIRVIPVTQWSHAMRVALVTALMVLLIVCALIVNYAMTIRAIGHSQGQWCDTLTLLTRDKIPYPADPAKNPSRVEAYVLYQDFVHIKDQFGCR
jgi:hypothetical protein